MRYNIFKFKIIYARQGIQKSFNQSQQIKPNELFKMKTFVSDGQNHIKDRS